MQQVFKFDFSVENVRNVYNFEKFIGGGAFGTVRRSHLKADPSKLYAIKSIIYEELKAEEK